MQNSFVHHLFSLFSTGGVQGLKTESEQLVRSREAGPQVSALVSLEYIKRLSFEIMDTGSSDLNLQVAFGREPFEQY